MTEYPLIGRQLANFKVEHVIGRGGMATVYYGQDIKLERPVAIKIIDARHRDNPAYAERFIREAKTVATWRHEHIIQIYYADDEDDLYYFVMEHIDGLDLHHLISQYADQSQLIPHRQVLRIGRAVAAALDYAHEQNVIHRDVKPSNVMVAGADRIVLTDFGLALDVEQGSMGEVFGSSHYIAPEQARRSADAVPQSDLYSLGIILYEMLTGEVPFDDPSPTAVALQHISNLPPPPREINPNLSPDVEAVLLKALSKSPDERYQTGQELLDALAEALQTDQPVLVEDPPAPQIPEPMPEKVKEDTYPLPVQVELPAPPEEKPAPPPTLSTLTDDLIGRQLDEYRLEALLGHGGMARVYRALDVRLQRYVAIKVIDAPFRSDSEYANRFEREAQAIAQLEHPHIVPLYRYGEAGGLLYMAMRYIEGADLGFVLDSYRAENEFIPMEGASRIIREVCSALDDAHSKGVIHRDIKPSNIMLDKKGRAILTDFGLALMTELGTKGEIFGSPHYIAPEQAISSAGAVPQSDFYAVGVILYQMFTNRLPFEADTAMDVAMLHMSKPPPPLYKLRPDISPEVEAVIQRLLSKEPEARYATGAELADAFEQALESSRNQTTPLTSPASINTSIIDRVAGELAEHPLPPIPAAVATPPLTQPEPEAIPEPPTLSEKLPAKEPEIAPPPSPPAAQIDKPALPPVPAAVATSTPPESDPQPASSPSSPDQALPPAPAEPKRTASNRPLLFVAGGLGLIVVVAIIVLILILVAVYGFV